MFGGGARNVEACEVGSVRRESKGEIAAAEVPTLCHTWTEKKTGEEHQESDQVSNKNDRLICVLHSAHSLPFAR